MGSAAARAEQLVHLSAPGCSLVLDTSGPGLPVVLHWGAAVGPVPDPVELRRAVVPAMAHGTLDEPARCSLVPQHAEGWPGRPGLSGRRPGGLDWSPCFVTTSVERAGDAVLHVEAVDEAAGLGLRCELELTPSGVVRLRHEVVNTGAIAYAVDGVHPVLPLPARAMQVLDFSGRWCRERQPQRHDLHAGAWVREGRRGRPGHDATIGLLVGVPGFSYGSGEVWAVHVGWSGNHVSWAERLPSGDAALGGGELLLPGEVELAPGESYTTPWAYFAYAEHGLDGLSATFHRYLRARPGHPGPDRPRPVTLNTWEAVYFDHDLDRLRRLADVAAVVGVERFVLDDGWFRHRRHDRAGLGDWYVDEAVWPHGLGPLADHVRDLGMQLGLWVEPEMVNPDSDLFRAHPDWILATGRQPARTGRHQLVLDLARPEVYEHLHRRLDALVTEHGLAYLKWDHNRDLLDAGHHGRPGVREQTLAVYRLLDELRHDHPGLEIESCASGGGRVDFGMLERTDRVWPSDTMDALERHAILWWTGLFLPPELLGAHVGPPRSHTTGRRHALSLRAAVALFASFGIEWDVTRASSEEQAELAAWVGLYRRHRRLLHSGTTVRVDHPDPGAAVHGVVGPDRSEALFACVQVATSPWAVPVRLPGLDPARTYRVEVVTVGRAPFTIERVPPAWVEAGGVLLPGRTLATLGLPLPLLGPEQALVLHVTAET